MEAEEVAEAAQGTADGSFSRCGYCSPSLAAPFLFEYGLFTFVCDGVLPPVAEWFFASLSTPDVDRCLAQLSPLEYEVASIKARGWFSKVYIARCADHLRLRRLRQVGI